MFVPCRSLWGRVAGNLGMSKLESNPQEQEARTDSSQGETSLATHSLEHPPAGRGIALHRCAGSPCHSDISQPISTRTAAPAGVGYASWGHGLSAAGF